MAGGARRRIGAGLLDQAIMALANAGTTLVGAILVTHHAGRAAAGVMLLAIGLAYTVMGLNRAFVGDVLLAQASRLGARERRPLIRHGLAAALVVGLAAAVVLFALAAAVPNDWVDLSAGRYVAPFLPFVLLHDTGRYANLAARRPIGALKIDVLWIVVQATLIGVFVTSGWITGASMLSAWGGGAVAGSLVYLWRSGNRPWQGNPRLWVNQTRRLSGWFTGTAVIAQIQVQAVAFLVTGPLGPAQLTTLRLAQTLVLQPVQNLVTASMGLAVPRSSRLAAGRNARGLRRQTNRLVLLFLGLGLVMLATLLPLAHLVLPRIAVLAPILPLTLPIGIQATVYLLQIPFSAAMRGMHRARALFIQYALFTAASLTGLLIGASSNSLLATVWGLTIGALVGLLLMVALYVRSIRRL